MTKRPPMIHTRLPPTLKERLEQATKESGRSLNAEVVWRLERSFLDEGRNVEDGNLFSPLGYPSDEWEKVFQELLRMLEKRK